MLESPKCSLKKIIRSKRGKMKVFKLVLLLSCICLSQLSQASEPCDEVDKFVNSFNENTGQFLEVVCENNVNGNAFFQKRDVHILATSLNGIEACNSPTAKIGMKNYVITYFSEYAFKLLTHLNSKLENPIQFQYVNGDSPTLVRFYNFQIPQCFLEQSTSTDSE